MRSLAEDISEKFSGYKELGEDVDGGRSLSHEKW